MTALGLGHARLRLVGLLATLVIAACSTTTVVPASGSASPSEAPSTAPTSAPGSAPAASNGGFAFLPDDVIAYYAGLGYTCSDPKPSTKAVGYSFRACTFVDGAGRTRVVGVVVDQAGAFADAFASVRGTAAEPILAPIDALDPLAAFLGATLGKDAGAALLPWLAGHLGDTHSETKVGDLSVATYTATKTDHSTLYVELASQAYLGAPVPSP